MTVSTSNKMVEQTNFQEVEKGGGLIIEVQPVFSNDAKKVIVALGKSIRIYHVIGGELLQEINLHQHKVNSICGHHTEENVYVSVDDAGEVRIWSIDPFEVKKQHKLFHKTPGRKRIMKRVYMFPRIEQMFISVTEGAADNINLYSESEPFTGDGMQLITNEMVPYRNTVTVTFDASCIAVVKPHILFIKHFHNKSTLRHKIGSDIEFRSIVSHPSSLTLATGDSLGRAIIWNNIFDYSPARRIYHWHTMPLNSMVFSSIGSELFTGGKECVIVKWHLNDKNKRTFLPRLGMPITQMSMDRSGLYIAAAQEDNSITIISNREWKRIGIIQGMALPAESNFVLDLAVHPLTNSLVMNAKCGSIQFYNLEQKKQLYQIDITMRNYITEERNAKFRNIEVTKIATSTCGRWIATYETEHPVTDCGYDFRLKFWEFLDKEQVWHLNTNVEMPHQTPLQSIDFQPSNSSEIPLCVTVSEDKFKLWQLLENNNNNRVNTCWNCISTAGYHDLPVHCVKFTPDGTMLAVAFHSKLTMWTPDNCEMKGVLTQNFLNQPLEQIVFGTQEGNLHLVVTRTKEWICCWNLITCALHWRVFLKVSFLLSNPLSGLITGFTVDKDVFTFEPKVCRPRLWKSAATSSVIKSAVFVPHNSSKPREVQAWGSKCYLAYISDDKILQTLESLEEEQMEVDEVDSKFKLHSKLSEDINPSLPQAQTVKKEKTPQAQAESISLESSINQYVTKLLADLTIHHMDSIGSLALEYCNLAIPTNNMVCPQRAPLEGINKVGDIKIDKPKKIEKIEKTNFQAFIKDIL